MYSRLFGSSWLLDLLDNFLVDLDPASSSSSNAIISPLESRRDDRWESNISPLEPRLVKTSPLEPLLDDRCESRVSPRDIFLEDRCDLDIPVSSVSIWSSPLDIDLDFKLVFREILESSVSNRISSSTASNSSSASLGSVSLDISDCSRSDLVRKLDFDVGGGLWSSTSSMSEGEVEESCPDLALDLPLFCWNQGAISWSMLADDNIPSDFCLWDW